MIDSNIDGTIDYKELCNQIKYHWDKDKRPAIVIMTWGTTIYGSIDEVNKIIKFLKNKKIDYYIHLDAAFYGGIPKNQIHAPIINNLAELDIDSISVSLHKFIGNSLVSGVVLKLKNMGNNNYVTYIGQCDSTFLGSRSILPFSTYQRVNEILNRSNKNEYFSNIKYFKDGLNRANIPYKNEKNSNIFLFLNLNEMIAKKYQLAKYAENAYHVIIMPFHERKQIDGLIKDLKKNYK